MSAPTFETPGDGRNQLHQHIPDIPAPNSSQQRSPSRAVHTPTTAHVSFLDRLRTVPEVRPIPWRPGQELPAERSIDSPRMQQRGAIMLATRGLISEKPCTHCEAGYGRFSVCITLGNWFQGACSSCTFTSKGNRCSLRHQISGNADGRTLRYYVNNPEVLDSVIRNAAEKPKPSRKRKKRPSESLVDDVYADPATRVGSTLAETMDLDTLLQAEIAREQDGINESRTRQKRRRTSQVAASNDTAHPTVADRFLPINVIVASKDQIPINTIQPARQRPELAAPFHGRSGLQGPSVPIIDTFPKAKQKLIYGYISGISNGIRHLQNELDSLRAVLGIDNDDSIASQ